jgi:iron complex outermembrane recepter protein
VKPPPFSSAWRPPSDSPLFGRKLLQDHDLPLRDAARSMPVRVRRESCLHSGTVSYSVIPYFPRSALIVHFPGAKWKFRFVSLRVQKQSRWYSEPEPVEGGPKMIDAFRIARIVGVGGSMLCYAAAASAAAAQAVPPQEAEQDADEREVDQDDGRNPIIYVTAQRRQENLQQVPVSATVFDQENLNQQNATRLRDLEFSVPNVIVTGAAENQGIDFVLRGIRASAFNAGFESGLSMYIDGVVMGRPFGFNQDLADIERIEVLRGPQGTLFGKNTLAGAFNIVTRRPTPEHEVRGTLSVGNYNLFQGHVSVNVPLSSNVFVRGTAFGVHRNGYYENVNGPDLDDEGAIGGRLQLRFVPTDRLTIDLNIDAMREDRNILFGEAGDTAPGSPPGPFTVAVNFSPFESRRMRGIGLTAEYEVADGYTLTSITGLRDAYSITESDSDATPQNLIDSSQAYDQYQFSQEIRLTSPMQDRFNYILGLFYFHQTLEQNWIDRFRPGFVIFDLLDPKIQTIDAVVTTDNYAAYGHFNFRVTDWLEFFGGLRYDHEEKNVIFSQQGIPIIGTAVISGATDSLTESNFVPLVGANVRPASNILLYAKFSQSFKSGGWNLEQLASIANWAFGSEYVNAYELGIKTDWFRNALRVNAALFRLDYEDLQVATFDPERNLTRILNAASARSQGVEVEVLASPLRWLNLQAAYGFTDAEYLDFQVSPTVNLRGSTLPSAARHTLSGSINVETPINDQLTFSAWVGAAWRSKAVVARANVRDPFFLATEQNSTTLVQARIGISAADERWSAFLWGRNLTDTLYLTSIRRNFAGVDQATFGPPRTYGVQVNFRF